MYAAVALLIVVLLAGGKDFAGYSENEQVLFLEKIPTISITKQPVKPLSEFKFKNIVKQEHDYSCGSAALGTLLNFCLGETFSEKQVINGLMEYGDKGQIKKLKAFSLWDMQRFVEALGYVSGGFNAEFSDLEDSEQWPCIVPVSLFSYRHFVVFKGITNGHVVIADPWRGNETFTVNQFKKMWYKNILFKITPKAGCLSNLKMKERDLRFIDDEMMGTLMFNVNNRMTIPEELNTQFYFGNSQRYKR